MLTVPAIAALACLLILCLLIFLVVYCRKVNNQLTIFKTQQSSNQLLIDELQLQAFAQNEKSQQDLSQVKQLAIENEQVTKQLEHRIKVLQQQQQQIETLINQVQHQQPEDKLYSRASKLVELGADIDEIMRECDIPRAEAEMLMSVHRNRKPS